MIEKRLFHPNSIVLFGASEDSQKFSGRPLNHLIKYGYQGKIYPINPKHEQLFNVKCYKNVDEIPTDQIDLSLILVPSKFVPEALEQCGRKGIRYNIIVASGFAETGNQELQGRMMEIAKNYNIRIIGPNCLGMVQPRNGVVPTFSTVLLKEEKIIPGNISLVTQSGALGNGLLQTFRDREIGLRTWITTGNEADLGLLDFLEYLIEDQETKVIGCFIEGLKEGDRIVDIGQRALKKNKQIVMLMGGRSKAGRQASSAHTGKIIGSGRELTKSVLNQAGIISVETLEELLDTLVIFSKLNAYPDKGVATLSVSGGMGVLLMDVCDQLGVEVALFSESTKKKLIDFLPPNITPMNPVDTINLGNEGYVKCADIVLEDPDTSHIVMILSSLAHRFDTLGGDFAGLSQKARSLGKTLSVSFLSPSDSLTTEVRRQLENQGIYVYEGNPIRALRAIKSIRDCVKSRQSVRGVEESERFFVESRRMGEDRFEIKPLKFIIEKYALPVPTGGIVQNRTEAVKEAQRVGYPVVIKVLSPEIQHKTESKLVRLDLRSAGEVGKALEEMTAKVSRDYPKAQITGISVEEMVKGGVECIVGISQSPEFGTVLMFGSGGILTELTKDVSYRAFPLGREDIREMMQETRVYQLLKGFRGENPKDIDQLVEEIIKVIQMYKMEKWINEVEINPFIVLDQGKGVRAVDFLIVPGQRTE